MGRFAVYGEDLAGKFPWVILKNFVFMPNIVKNNEDEKRIYHLRRKGKRLTSYMHHGVSIYL